LPPEVGKKPLTEKTLSAKKERHTGETASTACEKQDSILGFRKSHRGIGARTATREVLQEGKVSSGHKGPQESFQNLN